MHSPKMANQLGSCRLVQLVRRIVSFAALLVLTLMIRQIASMTTTATTCTPKGPAALIFLHGLGDSPSGWSFLESVLPTLKPRLKDVRYVFPPAPTIGLSINGGAKMPGWFDLYDWPIELAATDDRAGKLKAVAQIQQEVDKLEKEGIDKSRIVLGGFSQGGAIALLAAYREEVNPFAACVSLSGWLTLKKELNVSIAAKQTPLFWGHGKIDDKVLFEHQSYGVKLLEAQGVAVVAKQYPFGHQSDQRELEDLAAFVDNALYGEAE
jgi:predicted esterase